MASGKPCAHIGPFIPPESSAAGEDVIEGTTSVEEKVRVIDFDATSVEYIDIPFTMADYTSRGITVSGYVTWSSDTNNAHKSRIDADVLMYGVTTDPTASYSYSFTSQGTSISVADKSTVYITIFSLTIADEAGMTDGAYGLLRMRRDPTHADDDATGDMELWIDSIQILEQ